MKKLNYEGRSSRMAETCSDLPLNGAARLYTSRDATILAMKQGEGDKARDLISRANLEKNVQTKV
jgi:hypothetical protein